MAPCDLHAQTCCDIISPSFLLKQQWQGRMLHQCLGALREVERACACCSIFLMLGHHGVIGGQRIDRVC